MRNVLIHSWIVAALVMLISFPGHAQSGQDDERFAIALTGDSIITRRLSVYNEPQYLRMIELIRGADAAFTNLEVLFHDYESYPMHQSGGTYMRAEPELARDLAWAGFDLVSHANNHTGDYGALGMQLTMKYTREAGLVGAGVGNSLAEAREAKFLETAKGRVALISVSSTFPDHSRAGRSRDDIPSRPGLNPLRHDTTYVITAEQMTHLRKMLVSLGLRSGEGEGQRLAAFGVTFEIGARPAIRTTPHAQDMAEIEAVVRNAAGLADVVIVTMHAHESHKELGVAAEFVQVFARAMIKAGASVFVGHGPHVLRGIEFYDGKPILYSLGDFIFQNETLQRLPVENYQAFGLDDHAHVSDFNAARYNNDTTGFPANPKIWESVIAMPVWRDGRLVELKLHPITLGHGQPRQVRGRPMLADEELGKKIIGDLQALSKPFGTAIFFENGIGVVKLP